MAAFIPLGVRIGAGVVTAVAPGAYVVYKKWKARKTGPNSTACALCAEELKGVAFRLGCGDQFHVKCLKLYIHSHGKCSAKCPKCKKLVVLTLEEREDLAMTLEDGPHYCNFCRKITAERRQALLCGHHFCFRCLRNYLVGLVTVVGEDPRCPMLGCGALISSPLATSIIQDTPEPEPESEEQFEVVNGPVRRTLSSWFRIRSA